MGAPRMTVVLSDDTERTVALGAFSQIAAKRAYGMDALRSGDPEPALYSVWIELNGAPPKGTDAAAAFDAWLKTVESFEIVSGDATEVDDEDPPVAESSGSSPFSPPTSD